MKIGKKSRRGGVQCVASSILIDEKPIRGAVSDGLIRCSPGSEKEKGGLKKGGAGQLDVGKTYVSSVKKLKTEVVWSTR